MKQFDPRLLQMKLWRGKEAPGGFDAIGMDEWAPLIRMVQVSALACCGGNTISHFTSTRLTNKMKQEFLYRLLMEYESIKRFRYFIVTDAQERIMGVDTVLGLLLELGAKQIDDAPNEYHPGNRLHMYRWAPNQIGKALEKYLPEYSFDYSYRDYDGTSFVNRIAQHESRCPAWWLELSEAEQETRLQALYDEDQRSKERAAAKLAELQKQAEQHFVVQNQPISTGNFNALLYGTTR